MKRPAATATLMGGAIALVAVDLTSKTLAVRELTDAPVELPGPIDLRVTYNSGIAFGLFSNVPTIMLTAVIAAVGALLVGTWRRSQDAPLLPVTLVVAGTAANLIDRIESGSVVDMIHTGWWPSFNLADIYVVTGIAGWIITAAFPGVFRPPRRTLASQE